MARSRHILQFELADRCLERRELLSRGALPTVASQVAASQLTPVPTNLFHQDGVDGLKLHHSFLTIYNDRIQNSTNSEKTISQAFTAFVQGYQQAPVNPAPGMMAPTLDSLITTLKQQVTYALTVLQIFNNRPQPSVAHGPKFGKPALVSLVPYALEQIDQLSAQLAATPPVVGTGGTLVHADPTAAATTAFNAISNALAEYSIHPHLFLKPTDYYISPNFHYTLSYNTSPATSSPGYFVRGPGGFILPGATLHPSFPA